MAMQKENFNKNIAYRVGENITRITIQSKDNNTNLTRDIVGDHLSKSDEEQIQLVLDMVATEIDPTKAIAKAQADASKNAEALEKANGLMENIQATMVAITVKNDALTQRLDELEKALTESDEEEATEKPAEATMEGEA